MNRFLVALCGFGLGVLVGLAIALVVQPTLRQAQVDRAAAVERAAAFKAAAADAEERLAEALARTREAREKQEETGRDAAAYREAIERLADNEIRSQSLLGLLIYHPELRPLPLDAAWSESEGDWWAPEESWHFLHGSDLAGTRTLKEMSDRGVKARATFGVITGAAPNLSYRARLRAAKAGLKALPALEEAWRKDRDRKAGQGKNRAT